MTYREALIAANRDPHDHVCDPPRIVPHDGDVAMCVHCGRWWATSDHPSGIVSVVIEESAAGAYARADQDPYETLAAMERAEFNMEIEQ